MIVINYLFIVVSSRDQTPLTTSIALNHFKNPLSSSSSLAVAIPNTIVSLPTTTTTNKHGVINNAVSSDGALSVIKTSNTILNTTTNDDHYDDNDGNVNGHRAIILPYSDDNAVNALGKNNYNHHLKRLLILSSS